MEQFDSVQSEILPDLPLSTPVKKREEALDISYWSKLSSADYFAGGKGSSPLKLVSYPEEEQRENIPHNQLLNSTQLVNAFQLQKSKKIVSTSNAGPPSIHRSTKLTIPEEFNFATDRISKRKRHTISSGTSSSEKHIPFPLVDNYLMQQLRREDHVKANFATEEKRTNSGFTIPKSPKFHLSRRLPLKPKVRKAPEKAKENGQREKITKLTIPKSPKMLTRTRKMLEKVVVSSANAPVRATANAPVRVTANVPIRATANVPLRATANAPARLTTRVTTIAPTRASQRTKNSSPFKAHAFTVTPKPPPKLIPKPLPDRILQLANPKITLQKAPQKQEPLKHSLHLTIPKPFVLSTDLRGEHSRKIWLQKLQKQQQELKAGTQFRAQPPPTFDNVPRIQKSQKQPSRSQPVHLHSLDRIGQRAAFTSRITQKQAQIEEQKSIEQQAKEVSTHPFPYLIF